MEAQRRETRAANDTLSEASAEMENIMFENKQLQKQWASSLLAMKKRDEALRATEEAMAAQAEQANNINAEMEGLRKSLQAAEGRSETQMGVLKKVEGEAELVQRSIKAMRDKRKKMGEAIERLAAQLKALDEEVEKTEDELFLVGETAAGVEKEIVRVVADAVAIEARTLDALSDGSVAEKNQQRGVRVVSDLRAKVREANLEGTKIANDLARSRVEVMDVTARNERLKETLAALDGELEEKGRAIERFEVEIRRKNDEIERKTKDVDVLNKQLEKLTAASPEESLGPLEGAIKTLERDISAQAAEGRDLQRRWVALQTELVTSVAETNALTEKVARLRSERSVLGTKRARLEGVAAAAEADIAALDKATQRTHADLTRLNAAIAKNAALSAALAEDTRNLESTAMRGLEEAQAEAAALESRIAEVGEEKRALVAEIMERERQIMLWERKIKLEKETQEALDPDVGNDVIAAMRKEIHRMEGRHGELTRLQERLMMELERHIGKREGLAVRSTAGIVRSASKAPEVTDDGLRKALADLRRSVRETERETAAAEDRIRGLEAARGEAGAELDRAGGAVLELRRAEEAARSRLAAAEHDKEVSLFGTLAEQRAARRFEDFEAGRYRPAAAPEAIPAALESAGEKRARILQAADQILQLHPHLEPQVERVYVLMGELVEQ